MKLKMKRLMATFLDYFIFFYVSYLILIIAEVFTKNNMVLRVITTMFVMLVFFCLFLCKDILFGYESIGKKVMKLKIYDEDGNNLIDKKKLIMRTFYSFWLFPIYPFMILVNNRSIGDEKVKAIVK